MTRLALRDIVTGAQDFGPIPEKADRMSAVYMGQDRVMTRLWSGHRFLASTRDMIVTPHLIDLGVNEPHVTRTLMSLIGPGDVVVDVGANVGYYSVLAGWRAHPDGQVWSFEPNPRAFALLSDNMTMTGHAAMARRWPVALSDRAGTAALRIFPGYEATSTIRAVPEAFVSHTERETGRVSHVIDVELLRLDDAMRDVPAINVMKIDAEGHEPAIIAGAQEILRRSRTVKIVMEFVPPIMDAGDTRGMLRTIRDTGFSIYRIEHDSSFTAQPDDDALMAIPFSDLLLVRG